LHTRKEEIVGKCNGKVYTQNPGTQMLEVVCGMTMHGDRAGAIALLRGAPTSLLEAFQFAKSDKKGGTQRFFKEAFDRTADPCLEGRMGRIYEYLERASMRSSGSAAAPPWEEVSLSPLPESATVDAVVGEHLRVFMNECTWQWAQAAGLEYEAAKRVRLDDEHAVDFAKRYNAAAFAAAMRARGVVMEEEDMQGTAQWEVQMDRAWSEFEAGVSDQIERGRQQGKSKVECRIGPKAWRYEIDLRRFVQRNPKTGKERAIRCVRKAADLVAPSRRKLLPKELDESIRVYVEDLVTLPPAEG